MQTCADKPESWYWELLFISRRALLLALRVLLAPVGRITAFTFVTLTCMVVLVAHLSVHPFPSAVQNHMETASLFVLAVLSASQGALSVPYNEVAVGLLGSLLYVTAVVLTVWCAWNQVRPRPRGLAFPRSVSNFSL